MRIPAQSAAGAASDYSGENANFDGASFRDRTARVFLRNNQVFRALTASGLSDWKFAESLSCVRTGMQQGRIVTTKIVLDSVLLPESSASEEFCCILQHDRVPLISYAYEWSFSMLRDAALLQLSLMSDALKEDAILKDATPYNIQFRGTNPVLIDTPSLVRLRPGRPWDGYRQFCQMFLFPLMLQAYRGVDFQPWLRGQLSGISPAQMAGLLSFRDLLRRGVPTHVWLHSRLTRTDHCESSSTARQAVPESMQRAGFQKELIQSNIRGLYKLVSGLRWSPSGSLWADYDQQAAPVQLDSTAKETFVRTVLETRHWGHIWDVGCNLGRYSRLASSRADLVVAMDSDHLTIDHLYCSLRKERYENIVPLVMNLADPSPCQGWLCTERSQLHQRTQPELVLCLAVIHHLVIRENLLLDDVVRWLAGLRATLIIEFVDRTDTQVKSLLANRDDQFSDYSLKRFQDLMAQKFTVLQQITLPSQTRTLFLAEPRN